MRSLLKLIYLICLTYSIFVGASDSCIRNKTFDSNSGIKISGNYIFVYNGDFDYHQILDFHIEDDLEGYGFSDQYYDCFKVSFEFNFEKEMRKGSFDTFWEDYPGKTPILILNTKPINTYPESFPFSKIMPPTSDAMYHDDYYDWNELLRTLKKELGLNKMNSFKMPKTKLGREKFLHYLYVKRVGCSWYYDGNFDMICSGIAQTYKQFYTFSPARDNHVKGFSYIGHENMSWNESEKNQLCSNEKNYIVMIDIHLYSNTLAHEIGHDLGLGHLASPGCLMSGGGNTSDKLSPASLKRLIHQDGSYKKESILSCDYEITIPYEYTFNQTDQLPGVFSDGGFEKGEYIIEFNSLDPDNVKITNEIIDSNYELTVPLEGPVFECSPNFNSIDLEFGSVRTFQQQSTPDFFLSFGLEDARSKGDLSFLCDQFIPGYYDGEIFAAHEGTVGYKQKDIKQNFFNDGNGQLSVKYNIEDGSSELYRTDSEGGRLYYNELISLSESPVVDYVGTYDRDDISYFNIEFPEFDFGDLNVERTMDAIQVKVNREIEIR